MGTYFPNGMNREQLTDYLVNDLSDVLIAHERVGNILWGVVALPADNPHAGHKLIVCYKLDPETRLPHEPGWGYKPMDETVGPAYYSVPLSYLGMVDEPLTGFSKNWREKVRQLDGNQ